jgi:hypothetical protein
MRWCVAFGHDLRHRLRHAETQAVGRAPKTVALTGALIAVAVVAACGESRSREDPPVTAAARSKAVGADNVGTGSLRGTHFAVPPLVELSLCHEGPDECSLVNMPVWLRLTRNVAKIRRDGKVVANVTVSGAGSDALPADYDILMRLYGLNDKPVPGCFRETSGTDDPKRIGLPAKIGARVRVTLTEYNRYGIDSRKARAIGSLSTVVRLHRPYSRPAANDYGLPKQQTTIGC